MCTHKEIGLIKIQTKPNGVYLFKTVFLMNNIKKSCSAEYIMFVNRYSMILRPRFAFTIEILFFKKIPRILTFCSGFWLKMKKFKLKMKIIGGTVWI